MEWKSSFHVGDLLAQCTAREDGAVRKNAVLPVAWGPRAVSMLPHKQRKLVGFLVIFRYIFLPIIAFSVWVVLMCVSPRCLMFALFFLVPSYQSGTNKWNVCAMPPCSKSLNVTKSPSDRGPRFRPSCGTFICDKQQGLALKLWPEFIFCEEAECTSSMCCDPLLEDSKRVLPVCEPACDTSQICVIGDMPGVNICECVSPGCLGGDIPWLLLLGPALGTLCAIAGMHYGLSWYRRTAPMRQLNSSSGKRSTLVNVHQEH